MTKNRTKNITFILIAVIAMIAGAWLGSYEEPSQKQKQAETIQGVILPTAKTIRPFHLFDHDEQAFTEDSLKGQWSLLFVGYTQCPDICPAALSVLKQVHQLMTRQSLKVPRVVFISIDPERDTYPSLAKYVKYFNPEFIGATGEIDQLKIIAQQLSVSFAKAPGSDGKVTGDNYLMDHSSSFLLINPKGQLQSFLTGPHEATKIIDSINHSRAFYNEQINLNL